MKKWLSGFLIFALLLSLVLPNLSKAKAEVVPVAVLDLDLVKVLKTAIQPVQVVVTFEGDGPPTKAHLTLLEKLNGRPNLDMEG
ncbi:hypothetical protein [Neobacillus niacini]|uniref:hypothetical protein n=1 Tax=Neobacillus niacini TaxID=86668 RepID=UPI0021CB703C|nr:hypothetical protein [Neobacillus niacini]MCM3764113.1 hypothetical protein [Neobacillus niacini]